MLLKLSSLVIALGVSSALAAPAAERRERLLEDIQCRCLTFRANEQPSPCNFLESEGFGWRSAQTFASEYDIQVRFASKTTISKVLTIPVPLPNDVLQATSAGDVQPALEEALISQNKIVCGLGKEVAYMSHHHRNLKSEGHFVGQVVAWFMLLIVLYAAGEYVWTRFSSRSRPIKLKGDERPLKATSFKSSHLKEASSNFT